MSNYSLYFGMLTIFLLACTNTSSQLEASFDTIINSKSFHEYYNTIKEHRALLSEFAVIDHRNGKVTVDEIDAHLALLEEKMEVSEKIFDYIINELSGTPELSDMPELRAYAETLDYNEKIKESVLALREFEVRHDFPKFFKSITDEFPSIDSPEKRMELIEYYESSIEQKNRK